MSRISTNSGVYKSAYIPNIADEKRLASDKSISFKTAAEITIDDNIISLYKEKLVVYYDILSDRGIVSNKSSPMAKSIPNQVSDYLYNFKNINMCSPLNVRYLARYLNDSNTFSVYTMGVIQGKSVPKNMISWSLLGSGVHIIAFCTNKQNPDFRGGGLLIKMLMDFCVGANIPDISLYSLFKAEGYYLKLGFEYVTKDGRYITDSGGNKAMVWFNPSFNYPEYRTRYIRTENYNIPVSDEALNRWINRRISLYGIIEHWQTRVISREEAAANFAEAQLLEENPSNFISSTKRGRSSSGDTIGEEVLFSSVDQKMGNRRSSTGEEKVLFSMGDENKDSRRSPSGDIIDRVVVDNSSNQKMGNRRSSSGEEEVLFSMDDENNGRTNKKSRKSTRGGSYKRRSIKKTQRRHKTTQKHKKNKHKR